MNSVFFGVVAFIFMANLLWYTVSDRWLRRDLQHFPRARLWVRWALAIWMLLILVPLTGIVVPWIGNPLDYAPWLWTTIFYLWTGGLIFWLMGMALIGVAMKQTSTSPSPSPQEPSQEQLQENQQDQQLQPVKELSRRQLLRLGLVATPPLLITSSAGVAWWNKQRLRVYTQDLPVKNLPADLEGLTITQLSDIHMGVVTDRERVENMVTAANQLQSDIIVVTGDILDQDISYLPDLVETMGALAAPLGVYFCIGNHDKIYDANKWIATMRKAGFNLLLDQATLVDTGKTPVNLLGIDFSRKVAIDRRNINTAENTVNAPDNALKILLAHHPHAFDAACAAGIPVTLAGHTHGGQIVVKVGDKLEIFNPGKMLFRYVHGIYRGAHGESLFVHSGSGDWFPLRLGVLSEVVQLRLVRDMSTH